MLKKIILIILLMITLSSQVWAGTFTGDMTVSIYNRELYRVRTVGGSVPLTVQLTSSGSHAVKYRVINFNDEAPVSDWVTVSEGGLAKNANFADSWGMDYCYAGSQIYIQWKNATNFAWLDYNVYGTVNYY